MNISGAEPATLVVDEAAERIYYTDKSMRAIYKMTTKGEEHDSLVQGLGLCEGLVIDKEKG